MRHISFRMMKNTFTLTFLLFIIWGCASAQEATTSEDSLNSSASSKPVTTIGGYGNVFYQSNKNLGTSKLDLERFVLFVGHRFNSKISLFTETEVEDAKVAGGESGGEVAIEQAYLKFNLNPNQYIVAGLFLPRVGILNENHLPTQFNGNERNYVETLILPSTWRELGIGFYGNLTNLPLSYNVGIVNGLNSAAFEHGSGIREGRFEGRNATGNNLAITAALQYYVNNFRFQVSGYYGGTVSVSASKADSLGVKSGIFGTPVGIGEADLMYSNHGFSFRALGTIISIPDAADINKAFANNTPKEEYGAYAEVGYDLLYRNGSLNNKQLILFVRDEKLDVNAKVPANGIKDETLNQNHVVAGLTYLPIKNVVVKADVRVIHTGQENPNLVVNSNTLAYQQNNNLINLGVGYSF